MSAKNDDLEQQTLSNGLQPYRTMPLSRSWDEGPQDERQERFSLSRLEDQRVTMLRTFHNTVKAAEDVLKSPNAVTTARLGITPPTVSSSTPQSPPQYMMYRNNLALRLKTPSSSSSCLSQASPRQSQQPLDPVILSYDRTMEDENNSSGDSNDEMQSSDDSDFCEQPNLYAPLSNLHTRAFQYRIDESKPIPYVGANMSQHGRPWTTPENSIDTASAATEPTSNIAGHVPSPAISDGDASSDGDTSSDEENIDDSPNGPGKIYLEVLKKKSESKHRLPTPSRHLGGTAPIPQRLLEDDSITMSEPSTTLNERSLQLSRSGQAIFVEDYGSDDGNDLPYNGSNIVSNPPSKQSNSVQLRRKYCGICFILLAVALVAALILFVSLVSRNWKPQFLRDQNENRSPPVSRMNSSVPTTMPTTISTVDHTTQEPTQAPSAFPTSLPTKMKYLPTFTPSWDPVRLERLKDAVNLLSS